ncbi:hypothetical protein DAPPUDRAFT_239911 [Daphnia pulex]|uniref:Uncharacterized protein n=1 Tax=Daphnia pulex TaxID=6669 RepID=E9GAE6_DAPPU|nr:hypothetical protein DAPPUDRAFT_239911 [Daphnia pulex]|eukprot:EFX83225.1 hypothetical protein DAPPUDRAFT_239911 [Daphnia pulex]
MASQEWMTMAQWGMNERTNERTNQANNEIGSTSPFDLYCHSMMYSLFLRLTICSLLRLTYMIRAHQQISERRSSDLVPPTPGYFFLSFFLSPPANKQTARQPSDRIRNVTQQPTRRPKKETTDAKPEPRLGRVLRALYKPSTGKVVVGGGRKYPDNNKDKSELMVEHQSNTLYSCASKIVDSKPRRRLTFDEEKSGGGGWGNRKRKKRRKQERVKKIRTQKMTANRLGYLPAAGGTHQHSDDDATSKS